ncbi:MAG: hypothetical protein HY364_00055 [Candidatus Aenigmarchaeota archaeon]|nr:hypothetical protein [Candidatus Aenigmarchaeota archaeon]
MATMYACGGSCKGVVTEKQYSSGLNTCATGGCEEKGRPLRRTEQCKSCAAQTEKDGQPKFCESCTME